MDNKNDFKGLLLGQLGLYPNMQLQDFVKLIYQNEFGCGHMIADEAESLIQLRNQWTSPKGEVHSNIFEDIGGGLCRLHLPALFATGIKPETANCFFVVSANSLQGTVTGFEGKLSVLKECCEEGTLPYSAQDFEGYLLDYKSKGYPLVSHSEIYHRCYSPAYRVVKKEFCDYLELFCKIDRLMELGDRVTVAIDGNSGAGKSCLSELLGQVYDCNIIHMDHFFLPPGLKTPQRLAEIGGNVDYERFCEEVLKPLTGGCDFAYHIYDCTACALTELIPVPKKRLNIIEGCYSMHPKFIDSYDLKVFLQINPSLQSRRILKRSGKALHKRFMNEWIPMENQYFEKMKIAQLCDLAFSVHED